MKFNGTDWINVGIPYFSSSDALYIHLAFNSAGKLYVAYCDAGNSEKATVMTFDDINWVEVGTPGFSPERATLLNFAFNPVNDVPYVSYEGSDTSFNKANVMKFDGINWINVGPPNFSKSRADYPSLSFSPSGIPYVAYIDYANSKRATVMKYDSAFAGFNELQTSGLLIYPNPATDHLVIESVKTGSLSIVNTDGQQLLSGKITKPKVLLDISSLHAGVYFVRLTNDRTVASAKFIKR
jgi:hypothetical protein